MSQNTRPAANATPALSGQVPFRESDLDANIAQMVRGIVSRLLGATESDAVPTGAVVVATVEQGEANRQAARETAAKKWLKDQCKLPRLWHCFGQLSGWVLWLSVLWAIIGLIVALSGDNDAWPAFFILVMTAGLGWAGVTGINKEQKEWNDDHTFLPQTLAQILPLLPRVNPLETAYTDAVDALLKQQAAWGAGATQNVLQDLKTLLQTGKQTVSRRAEIEQAMSRQSVQALESELGRLAERAAQATDASARDAFKQSLILMEARLARAKSLEPLRQQLEAQEEVITQALAEAQSSLSGASLGQWAFAPSSGAAVHLPLAHLGDTVSQLRRQTEAVEQAVQEVVRVGAGTRGT